MALQKKRPVTFEGSIIRGAIEGAVAGCLSGLGLIVLHPALAELFNQASGLVGIASFLFVSAQVGVVLSILTQLGLSPAMANTAARKSDDRRRIH